MNHQKRQQKSSLDSAKARRMKFVQQVNEVIERVKKELEEGEAKGGDYDIDTIIASIKGAIWEELVEGWSRGH